MPKKTITSSGSVPISMKLPPFPAKKAEKEIETPAGKVRSWFLTKEELEEELKRIGFKEEIHPKKRGRAPRRFENITRNQEKKDKDSDAFEDDI